MINCRSSKRAFNRSVAVSFNIHKAWFLVGFGILVLFTNLSLTRISGQIFGLILSFLNNRLFRVALDGKYSQEYPVNFGVPQGSILDPTLFLLYINDFPDVTSNLAIRVDNTKSVIRYLLCGNNLRWLLILNLIYETLWTGTGSGLLISTLEKIKLFCLVVIITLVLLM